jgi:hypothetical protein
MAKKLSDIQSHDDLVGVLITLRAAAIYDLFGQIYLHNFLKDVAQGREDPDTLVAQLPEGQISLKNFIDTLGRISEHAFLETKRNANRALTRNLFKESFRITLSYCIKTNQNRALKAQKWFRFARIIANSASHNFILEFRPFDRSQLPVTYRGLTIDVSSEGEPLSINLDRLIGIVDDIIEFAKNDIS